MARAPRGYRRAATATNAGAKVDLSGPFFEPDADKRLGQNIRAMLQAVADEGEATVRDRSPRKSGAFAAGVMGRVASEKGRPWMLTAVISQTHIYPWRNKGQRGFVGRSEAEYRGGKAEARYRMFRAVTYQLRASRAVLGANLTKGLE
jgi:hypothetical protein